MFMDIIQIMRSHKINLRLEDLTEDLRGTLHVIAHAGHASNLKFIKDRQKWLKEKYNNLVSGGIYFITKEDCTSEGEAYSKFMGILESNLSPENIANECEEILYEHLI